jgi:hypothetical protein
MLKTRQARIPGIPRQNLLPFRIQIKNTFSRDTSDGGNAALPEEIHKRSSLVLLLGFPVREVRISTLTRLLQGFR